MPLHLLSKKSWNVYNASNIARVRHDEEAVAAQQALSDAGTASGRLALLRGDVTTSPQQEQGESKGAKDIAELGGRGRPRIEGAEGAKGDDETMMADEKGHFSLFGPGYASASQSFKKRYEREGQVTFDSLHKDREHTTWYTSSARVVLGPSTDPEKLKRETTRLVSDDPLVMMKVGSRRAKEVKRERREEKEERKRDMRKIDREEKKDRRRDRSWSRSLRQERRERWHKGRDRDRYGRDKEGERDRHRRNREKK